ncbi:head-tail connector protein [Lactococcus garvieae]|uniref:head-tail connector protein n=1 Tax=Lactococcus garvieae TaxID=1363 RepID=UPI003854CB97
MVVKVEDLLNQLSEDESRKSQLEFYLKSATNWVKNSITSIKDDDEFFITEQAAPLMDLAILSYAMDLWTHRSERMPATTAVRHMIGQLRGLYSVWKEEQDEEI